ncbi:hypothetical protein IB234_20570 [Pseudomonas sp. PDM16]|uniref:hypothetical protein n=1 Tax=Pseudomonas sp. PDM16 TaxID=2769292 RepID=UPI00178369DF|nr:hypothetical protein [Pseudomonas sp. PDM16]MBD9416966.1 hypothetical protein [Pseudomonas sp. PDM16]
MTINAYPAFEEMFLETYSLLTMDDRSALDASLVNIQQLRAQKTPSIRLLTDNDEAEAASALDLRIDALEQRLYVRIRHAMERM